MSSLDEILDEHLLREDFSADQSARFLFGVHRRREVGDLAGGIFKRLYGSKLEQDNYYLSFPWLCRSILEILDPTSYAEDDAHWVEKVGEGLRTWIQESRDATGTVRWLIVAPQELLALDSLPNCVSPEVPVRYHMAALQRVINPAFLEFAGRHRLNPEESSFYNVRVIGITCFTLGASQKTSDLQPYLELDRDVPVYVPGDDDDLESRWEGIEVVVASLREHMRTEAGHELSDDALVARILLIKMVLAEFTTKGSVRSWRALKRGDVVFLKIYPRSGRGGVRASYWCKFGSITELKEEYRKAVALRSVHTLNGFLYDVLPPHNLPADYLGVIASMHEGLAISDPVEFGAWLLRGTRPRGEFIAALTTLRMFLVALHARPDDEGAGPVFRPSTGPKYERLLLSARLRFEDSVIPILKVKQREADYQVLGIRSRDEIGTVEIRLKRLATGQLMIVHWCWDHWRWRLWQAGISESSFVKINPQVRRGAPPQTGHRRDVFFERIAALPSPSLKLIVQRLQEKLAGYIQKVGGREELILHPPLELYAVSAHGDFHPRNLLMVPHANGAVTANDGNWDLKIIDLADAVTEAENALPVAYDFATFEVDLKVRALPMTPTGVSLVDQARELQEIEEGIWRLCRDSLPRAALSPALGRQERIGWIPPVNVSGLPESLHVLAYWRHFALSCICDAVPEAIGAERPDAQSWSPLKAYAQALFLQSIAYLEYLDPAEAENQRALVCLLSANGATEYLL